MSKIDNVEISSDYINVSTILTKIEYKEFKMGKHTVTPEQKEQYDRCFKSGLPIPEKIIVVHHYTDKNGGSGIVLKGHSLIQYIKSHKKTLEDFKYMDIIDYTLIYQDRHTFDKKEDMKWLDEIIEIYK